MALTATFNSLSINNTDLSSPLSSNLGLPPNIAQQTLASQMKYSQHHHKIIPLLGISVNIPIAFVRITTSLVIVLVIMAAQRNIVDFVMGVDSSGLRRSVDLTILGDPQVQNGWKVKTLPSRRPIIYDPKSREKAAIRRDLKKEIEELQAGCPLFSDTRLTVIITYHVHGVATRKDLDNMSKFILDAMEGALYDNDKWIYELQTTKVSAALAPKTIVSIRSLPNDDTIATV